MMQAAYSAASGLSAQQRRIDTIADNISNVNTAGYKSRRTDFKDALYTTLPRMVQPQEELNMELGHGVLVSANNVRFIQGGVNSTGNSLDFCIEGDGFFLVESMSGEQFYTRSGALSVSMEDEISYLVTKEGQYVLDSEGRRISFEASPEQFLADNYGGMKIAATVTDPLTGEETEEFIELGSIGIYTFPNKSGLEAVGSGLFQTTAASGDAVESQSFLLHQGALEASNVDMAQEVTRLIRTQRAFSFASRALSMADQMEGLANTMRR